MKKADKYILITLFVIISLSIIGIYIYQTFFTLPGTKAIITQNGQVVRTIDLDRVDRPYDFTLETGGGGYNTIHVEKGNIKFSDANCPDKLCVQTGGISKTDDIAVCLPHRLFLEIRGGEESDIDILSH